MAQQEFIVEVAGERVAGPLEGGLVPSPSTTIHLKTSELFLYLLSGEASVEICRGSAGGEVREAVAMATKDTLLIQQEEEGVVVDVKWGKQALCLCVHY